MNERTLPIKLRVVAADTRELRAGPLERPHRDRSLVEITCTKCGKKYLAEGWEIRRRGFDAWGHECWVPLLREAAIKEQRRSEMEAATETFLKAQGIKHVAQARLSGCRNIRDLLFDFQIFRSDGSFFLLELDGIYHYKNIYGQLDGQQRRDRIKNQWCKENGITLVRIPYSRYSEAPAIIKAELEGLVLTAQNSPDDTLN